MSDLAGELTEWLALSLSLIDRGESLHGLLDKLCKTIRKRAQGKEMAALLNREHITPKPVRTADDVLRNIAKATRKKPNRLM